MAPVSKEVVLSDKAPAPKPFLCQAVTLNSLVYTSGAVGMDPVTEELVAGTTADRTEQCLMNISSILEAAGSSIEKVLKVSIFIDDMANYGSMNEGYMKIFNKGSMPARTCVAVKQLPLGTDVEIEVVAHQ